MQGLLYHVASIKVLGADGHPLSIPQDEKKWPLKPGDPARTAPVVATETALHRIRVGLLLGPDPSARRRVRESLR
jgi:hypothetical protein